MISNQSDHIALRHPKQLHRWNWRHNLRLNASTLATMNNFDNNIESGEVQNNQGKDDFIQLLCCQTFDCCVVLLNISSSNSYIVWIQQQRLLEE